VHIAIPKATIYARSPPSIGYIPVACNIVKLIEEDKRLEKFIVRIPVQPCRWGPWSWEFDL
jgi:hypothetical protein